MIFEKNTLLDFIRLFIYRTTLDAHQQAHGVHLLRSIDAHLHVNFGIFT
jgi:hypothetical protein